MNENLQHKIYFIDTRFIHAPQDIKPSSKNIDMELNVSLSNIPFYLNTFNFLSNSY